MLSYRRFLWDGKVGKERGHGEGRQEGGVLAAGLDGRAGKRAAEEVLSGLHLGSAPPGPVTPVPPEMGLSRLICCPQPRPGNGSRTAPAQPGRSLLGSG